jgi:catechol 2,3-dioxygenase-like lactoylglutathione lyase family enzyme
LTATVGGVSELRIVMTVDDFDAAVALYRDTLGMPQLADYSAPTGRVIVVAAGRATIEIADPRHAAYVDDVEVGRRVAGQIRIALEVADVRQAAAAALDRGAILIAAPTPTPWGSLNSRLDDGNGVQLTLFGPPDAPRRP